MLYDEVQDDDRVSKRLRQDHDDFVVDDDGRGYTCDDEDEETQYYSDGYTDERTTKGTPCFFNSSNLQSDYKLTFTNCALPLDTIGSKKNGKGSAAAKDVPKPKAKESIRDAFMKAGAQSRVSKPTVVRHRFDEPINCIRIPVYLHPFYYLTRPCFSYQFLVEKDYRR